MKETVKQNQGDAIAKPNVQDEPTAESGSASAAEAGREPQTGGGSAPSPCSGVVASDN